MTKLTAVPDVGPDGAETVKAEFVPEEILLGWGHAVIDLMQALLSGTSGSKLLRVALDQAKAQNRLMEAITEQIPAEPACSTPVLHLVGEDGNP